MPHSAAFCAPLLGLPARTARKRKAERGPVRADLGPVVEGVPVGTLIAAGVSVGIVGATFENMLNVVYRRPSTVRPSDDELCAFCSGFGSVRCELCGSRGVITILGTSVLRQCPVCEGRKRERCRRCAGNGKSGMKKSAVVSRETAVKKSTVVDR